MKQFLRKKREKGITLIALVITIIILLILAAVTISALSGDNGILRNAAKAREATIIGKEKELIEVAYNGCKANNYTELEKDITAGELQDEIRKNEKEVNVTGEGTLIVEYTQTGNVYAVTQEGEITKTKSEEKPLPIYARLYTDKTLILSGTDYVDPNRTIAEDYGDISQKEYGYILNTDNNFELVGNLPGWFDNDVFSWYYNNKVTNVIIYDEIHPTNMLCWFMGMDELTELNLSNVKTEKVTNMAYLFSFCMGLTELNISHFNTENVTDMHEMFSGLNLRNLNVSKLETKNVTDMSCMFQNSNYLTSLDVSNFSTENVTNMRSMFDGCAGLTSLKLSNFNTENVTDMSSMFYQCENLSEINLSGFDTKNVTDMSSMFYQCKNLSEINLSGFDTKNVTDMSAMFMDTKLTQESCLNIGNFNVDKVEDFYRMFLGVSNVTIDISSWNILNEADIESMFHGEIKVYVKDGAIKSKLEGSNNTGTFIVKE